MASGDEKNVSDDHSSRSTKEEIESETSATNTNKDVKDEKQDEETTSMRKQKEEEEEVEVEEEDDDANPRLEGRNIVFKSRIVNEFLVCTLCMGYFREATTTCECLHTFCKSCIYKYFQSSSNCPRCDTNLGPNPMERIRFDRTLTEIVSKLFPQIIAQDLEREKEFYLARGVHLSTPTERSHNNDTSSSSNKRQRVSSSAKIVGFRLVLDQGTEETDIEGLKELERSYLSTREANVLSILHLKKFLQIKLGLASTTELDIVYKGEVLTNEYTLEYILKTRGSAGVDTPELKYRRRKSIGV